MQSQANTRNDTDRSLPSIASAAWICKLIAWPGTRMRSYRLPPPGECRRSGRQLRGPCGCHDPTSGILSMKPRLRWTSPSSRWEAPCTGVGGALRPIVELSQRNARTPCVTEGSTNGVHMRISRQEWRPSEWLFDFHRHNGVHRAPRSVPLTRRGLKGGCAVQCPRAYRTVASRRIPRDLVPARGWVPRKPPSPSWSHFFGVYIFVYIVVDLSAC